MNEKNFEENPTMSFVQRWIKAFSRILSKFRLDVGSDNKEFVDNLLSEESEQISTPEEKAIIEEKKKLLLEMCEDVDSFYEAKKEASKSRDLESWFRKRVSDFTRQTIPDADKSDIDEVENLVSESMDQDIQLHTKIIEEDFNSDGESCDPSQKA